MHISQIIDLHCFLVLLIRHLAELFDSCDGCVVDQHVYFLVFLDYLVPSVGSFLFLAEVRLHEIDRFVIRLDLVNHYNFHILLVLFQDFDDLFAQSL